MPIEELTETRSDELLSGGRLLHQAFLRETYRSIRPRTSLFRPDDPDPGVILLHRGFALRHCALPDGRRSILDVLVAGDIAGLDHTVLGHSRQELTALTAVGYQAITAAEMCRLMANQSIALRVLAIVGQSRRRVDRHLAAVSCLNARERLCVFLLDIYDRLRRRGLAETPRFHLPMKQQQIAHYLGITTVHTNRMVQELRKEGLLEMQRQIVVLKDLDKLRQIVDGLPPMAMLPESLMRDGGGDMGLAPISMVAAPHMAARTA